MSANLGAGLGLRPPHCAELLRRLPSLALVEVHSENYFGLGGLPLQTLDQVRAHYPLSLHGVGLSLGSTQPLCRTHLKRLRALVDRVEPALVSEHLSWNAVPQRHLHDLLPLPHTGEAIEVLVSHINQVQDVLRRPLLVENVASYLRFVDDEMSEAEFIATVIRRAGCQLLLDLNNLYVNAHNHRFDAAAYLAALDPASVGEIHLAAHTQRQWEGGTLLIDTHDGRVSDAVWHLLDLALRQFGAQPVVIEWDSEIPPFDVLLAEVGKANSASDFRVAR